MSLSSNDENIDTSFLFVSLSMKCNSFIYWMEDLEKPLNEDAPDDIDVQPKENSNKDEVYRLAGRPPLITLSILGVGPFVSQIVSGMYGVVTTMWVNKAMGPQGMAAVSLFTNLDNLGRAFGFFMNCSASQKISSLFGEKKGAEAGQVICDLLRCCVLCGIVVPAILLPLAPLLGRWFGADEITNHNGLIYLSPLLGGSVITCFYLMLCGALQAEGRTILVSALQISSFTLNMGFFCPIFLLVFKMGTVGAGLATICSDLCPTIFLFIYYFRGKFGVKPKFSGLLKKFSPHTWPALSVGVSQLASQVSRSVPSILLRKFLGETSKRHEDIDFNDTMAGFNAVLRIYGITDSIRLAISMALLPAASYANSANLFKRLMFLIIHASWMNLVWGTSTCLLTAFGSKYVAMILSKDENYLKMAIPMIQCANWEAPFAWVRYECQTILQALSYGNLATWYSFGASFIVAIGAYCMLYYTDKSDVIRLFWAYSIISAVSLVVGVIILIQPIRKIYTKSLNNDVEEAEEDIAEVDEEAIQSQLSSHILSESSHENLDEI